MYPRSREAKGKWLTNVLIIRSLPFIILMKTIHSHTNAKGTFVYIYTHSNIHEMRLTHIYAHMHAQIHRQT